MLIQLRFWPHDPLWPSSLRMASGQYRAQLHFGSRDPICMSGGSCQKNDFCCDKSFVMSNMCLLCVWCDKHVFAAVKQMTKHVFCPNKSMLVVREKKTVTTNISFVATNICRDKDNSVCLSWQTRVCRDKPPTCRDIYLCLCLCFVATKIFRHDKPNFVATKQAHFCHNKHAFAATKVLLWQKAYLRQLPPMTNMTCLSKNGPLLVVLQHVILVATERWQCQLELTSDCPHKWLSKQIRIQPPHTPGTLLTPKQQHCK